MRTHIYIYIYIIYIYIYMHLSTNSAGIPYTLLLKIEATGFPTSALLL